MQQCQNSTSWKRTRLTTDGVLTLSHGTKRLNITLFYPFKRKIFSSKKKIALEFYSVSLCQNRNEIFVLCGQNNTGWNYSHIRTLRYFSLSLIIELRTNITSTFYSPHVTYTWIVKWKLIKNRLKFLRVDNNPLIL